MIVPNYIPDPLEVPKNVTEQAYLVRLGFVRRSTVYFALSIAAVSATSQLDLPPIRFGIAIIVFVTLLLILEIWRILTRGKPIEGRVSAAMLPVVIVSAAFCVHALTRHGWPTWQILAATGCIVAYTLLCGRDYSFVGNFFLSLICSSVVVAAGCTALGLDLGRALFALGTNLAFLFYVLYDMASLLSRRRLGEEIAAATDVYRDVFNIFGYLVRVLKHWRRHRLWSLPNPIEVPWRRKA